MPIALESTDRVPGRIDLHLPRDLSLSDELLFAVCQANRELRIERSAHGDLEIMPPTGAETGMRNAALIADLVAWARQDGRGIVFDSSTGFLLPNGAMRSPDVSWVLRSRLSALSPRQKRQFLPLAPDLVVELASPTDDLDALHAKMREWRDNGLHLGWLILPDQRQVWRYLPHSEPVCLDDLQALQDDERLPGLSLPLAAVWAPML